MTAPRVLVDEARDALRHGDLARVGDLLRAAAAAWHGAGDAIAEAGCHQLASAVGRHAGTHPGPVVRRASGRAPDSAADSAAGGAADSAAGGAPGGASARAPDSAAGGASDSASDSAWRLAELESALDRSPPDGPRTRIGLEQRYATALLAAGRPAAAADALRRAAEGHTEAGAPVASARVLIDGVTLLQLAGYAVAAGALALAAEAAVADTDDHASASELALLAAARACAANEPVMARRHAERARLEALAGRLPGGYAAAAVVQAELAEATGDLTGAYASLAGGWVTLHDLVGEEPARDAFEPRLRAAEVRWGSGVFAAARRRYHDRRPSRSRSEVEPVARAGGALLEGPAVG